MRRDEQCLTAPHRREARTNALRVHTRYEITSIVGAATFREQIVRGETYALSNDRVTRYVNRDDEQRQRRRCDAFLQRDFNWFVPCLTRFSGIDELRVNRVSLSPSDTTLIEFVGPTLTRDTRRGEARRVVHTTTSRQDVDVTRKITKVGIGIRCVEVSSITSLVRYPREFKR